MHKLFSKFVLIGAGNFVFTFVVFTLLLEVVQTGYVAALLVAWVLGSIVTYTLNFIWVFRPEAKLNFRGRFVRYMLAGSASVGLNLVLLGALVELAGYDPFWSQVGLIPLIIIFNFSTAHWWSLKKKAPAQ